MYNQFGGIGVSNALEIMRNIIATRGDEVEAWFAAHFAKNPPPIYTSVDIRHSGPLLAPVDTNLFPAGFNNLSAHSRQKAADAMRPRLAGIKNILLVPEEHTRNLKYLDSLSILSDILRSSGAEVRIGTLGSYDEPQKLVSAEGYELVQYPLKRDGDVIKTADGFTPDLIVLNNDLNTGLPPVLANLAQKVEPPVWLGWYKRRKSQHFAQYREVVEDFCRSFGLESWRFQADFETCGKVDFREMTGLECVAMGLERLQYRLRGKYAEHGIANDPYVFIKSDSGTYGMGVMTARSAAEVLDMNRKNRKKMQSLKGGAENTEVIIHEGVPTIDYIGGATAEPMLYLVNGVPVGGAYRVHDEKDNEQSLNSVGMRFHPLCEKNEKKDYEPGNCDFCVLGVIGRLAALAAAMEDYS